MCLSEMRRGEQATVGSIPDETLRTQLLRFGIAAGCQVRCSSRLPYGPIVVRFGGQEIALGRTLAAQIVVTK